MKSTIYIDADACPVRKETIKIAERNKIKLFIVCNGGLRPENSPIAQTIVVDQGANQADKWILENIKPSDIVITADTILAAECLEQEAHVISYKGETFSQANIGIKLATKDLLEDIRSANPYFQNKTKPFSRMDKTRFINSLQKLVQRCD